MPPAVSSFLALEVPAWRDAAAMMKTGPRTTRIVGGTIAVTAAIAWAVAARVAARERRGRLRRGEIRELEGRWATVGGLRVFARVSTAAARPDRPPVVLVHGFGISSSYFVPTAERLAAEFAVFAPDLPGHGQSETPPGPMDVPRLAEALVAWMDAAGLGRVALVANSMGCQVAIEAAARFPSRFDRIVLIGPTTDRTGCTVVEHLLRLVLGGPFERPSLLWHIAIDYVRMGPRLFAELGAMCRDRVTEKLPLVVAPALLVRGEHDFIAPRPWLVEASRSLGRGRIVEVPWWGHAVQYSGPRELVAAVAPFLRASPDDLGGGAGAAPAVTGRRPDGRR